MAHVHNIIDADAHFIIDPITRLIKNKTQNKVRLIQGDHNCERFSFEMPKLVEGHDMTKCNHVQVHYNNIDAGTREENKGVYEINDMHVNGENIVFSWLITENVTKLVGKINFLIVFKCTTGEVVDYKWHTDINSEISISDGMNNTEEVTELFPDILAQWKDELFEAGGNAVVNVNVAEANAIEAVQEEGATQIKNVKTEVEEIKADRERIYINHMSKASVIEGNAEGQSIILGDSANMPFVGLSVFGKSKQETTAGNQLLNPSRYDFESGVMINGVIVTVNENGSITVNGTPTNETGFVVTLFLGELIDVLEDGETYTCNQTFEYIENDEKKYNRILTVDKTKYSSIRCYIQRDLNIYVDGETFFPIVNKGTEVLPWEPYTNGPSPNPEFSQEIESVGNVEVNIFGINLFDDSELVGSEVESIHGNMQIKLTKGTYFVDVNIEGEITENEATLVFYNANKEKIAEVNTLKEPFFELTESAETVNIYPFSGAVGGTWVSIMINAGETLLPYDSYKEKQSMQIPYTLHGIPVTSGGNYTDTDGKQYICDEVDFLKKKYIQRVEETILNGETIVLSLRGEMDETVYVITKDNNRYIPKSNLLCDRLPMKNTIYSTSVEGIRVEGTESSFGIRFRIKNERLKTVDVAGVKEYLANNPMRVLAPLIEPIETPLTDEELEAYKALCTNYPNTTVLNDSNAFMRVIYGIDTKSYIDNKFEELRIALSGE